MVLLSVSPAGQDSWEWPILAFFEEAVPEIVLCAHLHLASSAGYHTLLVSRYGCGLGTGVAQWLRAAFQEPCASPFLPGRTSAVVLGVVAQGRGQALGRREPFQLAVQSLLNRLALSW